jgi:hypothetical protein
MLQAGVVTVIFIQKNNVEKSKFCLIYKIVISLIRICYYPH